MDDPDFVRLIQPFNNLSSAGRLSNSANYEKVLKTTGENYVNYTLPLDRLSDDDKQIHAIILKERNDSLVYNLLQITPDESWLREKTVDFSTFSGTLTTYPIMFNESESSNGRVMDKAGLSDCMEFVVDEFVVHNDLSSTAYGHWQPCAGNGGGGSGGSSGGGGYFWLPTWGPSGTSTWINGGQSAGGVGSGSASSGVDESGSIYEGVELLMGGVVALIGDLWETENITTTEDFENNDCLMDVLEELKETNAVASLLDKFGNSSWIELTFDASLSSSANAITSLNGSEVKINFNTSKLGRSKLSIARTFLHEMVHAELARKVTSVGGVILPDDFPGIYDYYMRFVKNWQHQQMAAHYINTIANGLSMLDGGGQELSYYKSVAWIGLWKIPDYSTDDPVDFIESQAWQDLTSEEQKTIKDAIAAFQSVENDNCQ